MRTYTVKEVDELRRVCGQKWLFGTYNYTRRVSRCYVEATMYKCVEEMVRTHMHAGHTADDLLNSEKE